jgi:hypothetical protein
MRRRLYSGSFELVAVLSERLVVRDADEAADDDEDDDDDDAADDVEVADDVDDDDDDETQRRDRRLNVELLFE